MTQTKDVLTDEDYNPREFDLMNVQVMEDRANRASMTLNANAKVLVALASFYEGLMANNDFELRSVSACRGAMSD
ncbi:hypothetical protein, partial [Erythrobacter sp. YJ-T3-07]|uniref:hypothetical protein n=1 Tax=Erythrobacter sp. YJ-T3-07 TaxID=2793063 RepID=UPI001F26F917